MRCIFLVHIIPSFIFNSSSKAICIHCVISLWTSWLHVYPETGSLWIWNLAICYSEGPNDLDSSQMNLNAGFCYLGWWVAPSLQFPEDL
jgi:hypothetical protein